MPSPFATVSAVMIVRLCSPRSMPPMYVAVQPTMVRERFLRKAFLPPEFADAPPEEHLQFFHFQ